VEFIEVLKHFFEAYGAAALPYMFGALLVWLVLRDRDSRTTTVVSPEYSQLIHQYHEAVVDVTKTIERLAVLIEERTRRNQSQR
jgi:hypothetical protein